LNISGIIGSIILHRKKIIKRNRKIEYLSITSLIRKYLGDKREKKTFEPSSGGIGIKLNIANTIFIITTYTTICIKEAEKELAPYLRTRPKTVAIRRFEIGPAIEIRSSPHLLFFTLFGFHSTGFAQPKVKPAKEVMTGTTNEPKSSKCFRGLRVRRPWSLGVGSPNNSATYP
jgi:hypothetical protein